MPSKLLSRQPDPTVTTVAFSNTTLCQNQTGSKKCYLHFHRTIWDSCVSLWQVACCCSVTKGLTTKVKNTFSSLLEVSMFFCQDIHQTVGCNLCSEVGCKPCSKVLQDVDTIKSTLAHFCSKEMWSTGCPQQYFELSAVFNSTRLHSKVLWV